MNFQGFRNSKLVQRNIFSPGSADRKFSRVIHCDDGSAEIPIVLGPRLPYLFYLYLTIPSDLFVLWQNWHHDMGQLSPGVIWAWPSFYHVSHVVTRATITYNAPARNCPTADNVMVHVDLSLTFCIGPDANAEQNFVYRLGVYWFDELLTAEA
jgi:hypothetical protein